MPIAKEILSMFEFSQNQKNAFSILISQQRSVPTEHLTLSVHKNLLIESHRNASVALWVHPFCYLHMSTYPPYCYNTLYICLIISLKIHWKC